MKTAIQNRTARCVVAALLGSDLSENDLKEVADEFARGSSLAKQIGITLDSFLNFERGSSSAAHHHGVEKTPANPLLNEAMSVIKKKRLSKVTIIRKMSIFNPQVAEALSIHMDMPLQLMLSEFFRNISHEKAFAFLTTLNNQAIEDDEYLRGIMREKN